jgi:hypothetical protein
MEIVVAGDSYVYGQGCSDRPSNQKIPYDIPSLYCWPSLIPQHYNNIVLKNCAMPGADNITIVNALSRTVTSNTKLVIFCLTFISRIPTRHPDVKYNSTITISPHFSTETSDRMFVNAAEQYYKYLYSDMMGYNVMAAALLAAYGAAKHAGADFLWSRPVKHALDPLNQEFKQFGPYQFMPTCDIDYTDDELASCRHPNDLGHARYFKQVIVPLVDNFFKNHNE